MLLKIIVLAFSSLITAKVMYGQTVTFVIDPGKTAQTIDNFGASGAWFSEGIGKYWRSEQKERLAELLFSKKLDKAGAPLGIGLSAWRFNIGGGTAEQGDSSGIKTPVKRVECFLSPDGTYNWNKQQGYLWFVKQAVKYGVKNLIAFSNTAPVQFNKNGLGFKTEKNYEANLREDKYDDYADFLVTIIQHFKNEGIYFNYISPVNEPQWDWSNKFGQMNQEGSPWHNKDIYKVAVSLDSALSARNLSAKILIPESAMLTALYEGQGHASNQIKTFFSPGSTQYIGNLKHIEPVIAGHSYFTDNGDSNIINIRRRVRDSADHYKVSFWQSEYSMLADGYKEGKKGKIEAMDCALFLSKIIHHDLAVANASAWQLWNVWEPGNAAFDTRYYLVALKNNPLNTEGDFTVTKNLWALGHYSRFIRPGMRRIIVDRSDSLTEIATAKNVMLSSFAGNRETVVVAVNYSGSARAISLEMPGGKRVRSIRQYITSAKPDDNMKLYPLTTLKRITLRERSITTIVIAAK